MPTTALQGGQVAGGPVPRLGKLRLGRRSLTGPQSSLVCACLVAVSGRHHI